MAVVFRNQFQKIDLKLGNIVALCVATFFVGCTLGWIGAIRSVKYVVCDGPNSMVVVSLDQEPSTPRPATGYLTPDEGHFRISAAK